MTPPPLNLAPIAAAALAVFAWLGAGTGLAQDAERRPSALDLPDAATEAAPASPTAPAASAEPRERHGDWQVMCDPAGGSGCFMTQGLASDGNALMVALVAKDDRGEAVLRLTVPLGVLLPGGVEFAVDGREVGALPFLLCTEGGCVTQGVLEPDTLQGFRAGAEATATLRRPDGSPVELPISLKGFTAAFNSL